jgi:putative ABC transport system permease protein
MIKIRWPFVTQKRDDDMSQEMAFHIESTTRELVRGGMSERDARLEARRRFGSVLKQKEAGHEIRVGRILEDILRDARFMSRGLRRSLGFTTAVVLTLALGIGANTTIFSVVDQVMLRPLPYPQGDNLVMVYETGLRSAGFGDRNVVSPRELAGLAARESDARRTRDVANLVAHPDRRR